VSGAAPLDAVLRQIVKATGIDITVSRHRGEVLVSVKIGPGNTTAYNVFRDITAPGAAEWRALAYIEGIAHGHRLKEPVGA
jgi:hypothetical protein